MHRGVIVPLLAAICATAQVAAPLSSPRAPSIRFVFTSDAHYGLTRPAFRGGTGVDAHVVNSAMIGVINRLGPLDFIVEGGDVANRAEETAAGPIQSAADSWSQFRADYIEGLTATTLAGKTAPLYLVPGNHDVSNAIGFYKPMRPPVDKSGLVDMYNRMMAPGRLKTPATYDYAHDRVLYSHTLGGVHFVFLTIWPDSAARAWLEHDLEHVGRSTPVVVFTHDQPEAQAKHFSNPNGRHDINATDRFENLLDDRLADGTTIDAPTLVEQRDLERFLARHPNITAYFHGNSNWNEFYDWTGPDHLVRLHVFRVDSPMKGAVSGDDERRLSFHLATIDTAAHTLTVRECLWNERPDDRSHDCGHGESRTVDLLPSRARESARPGTR